MGGLAILGDYDLSNPFAAGNDVEVMEARDWPFTRIKPPPEEEEMKTIRTSMTFLSPEMSSFDSQFEFHVARAWVVDVPNALHIATMLRLVAFVDRALYPVEQVLIPNLLPRGQVAQTNWFRYPGTGTLETHSQKRAYVHPPLNHI